MADEIESLRAEVAALRAEIGEQRQRAITRRRLLTGLAGLGAAGAAGVASSPGAAADDLDPLILGTDNVASDPTTVTSSSAITLSSDDDDYTLRVHNTGSGFAAEFLHGILSYGIIGVSSSGFVGVSGSSEDVSGIGVEAIGHDDAFGLVVDSEHAAAVKISSVNGPHVVFTPVGGPGPTDGHLAIDVGALTVDSNLDLWLCTEAGDPPTWTRLLREDTAVGRTIPVPPTRALDTRATGGKPPGSPTVPGQKKGPLKGGETITLDLAGVGPIPDTASGVVGNLTVVSPTYSGYLTAGPSGTTSSTSAINFTSGAIVANAFTSQLGPAGLTIVASGTASKTFELIVDITAYIS